MTTTSTSDEENPPATVPTSSSRSPDDEFDETLEELNDGCPFELFEILAHLAGGSLDVVLLAAAAEVLEYGSTAETNARGYLAFIVLASLLLWWWGLAKFVLPLTKFFVPKKYWLWLGDTEYTCCCDVICGSICAAKREGHYGCFHPYYAIIADMLVSDLGLSIWSYFEYFNDDPGLFYIKTLLAVLEIIFNIRTLHVKIKKAQKLKKLKENS